jgi:hypothetical protein
MKEGAAAVALSGARCAAQGIRERELEGKQKKQKRKKDAAKRKRSRREEKRPLQGPQPTTARPSAQTLEQLACQQPSKSAYN